MRWTKFGIRFCSPKVELLLKTGDKYLVFSSRKQNYLPIIYLITIFSTLFLIIGFERLSYSQVQQGDANNTLVIQNISNNIGNTVYAQTESSENNVFVVWQDKYPGNNEALSTKTNL